MRSFRAGGNTGVEIRSPNCENCGLPHQVENWFAMTGAFCSALLLLQKEVLHIIE